MRKKRLCLALGVALAPFMLTASAMAAESITLWTTGDALMPGWGLYPNGTKYGGTPVLGKRAAWGTGKLTWVAEFPETGTYQVWVRRYGGYGRVIVTVDEESLTGGKGGGGGARYVWRHKGISRITAGQHHVDVRVRGTMFDAVLFTTDAAYNPAKGPLPEPIAEPRVGAPRAYRDDSKLENLAGSQAFVVADAKPGVVHLNDALPDPGDLIEELRLWGAPNQYVSGSFIVRAVKDTGTLTLSIDGVTGPQKTRIPAANIDLRVVHLRKRVRALYSQGARGIVTALTPDLLLRDDRTGIPPKGEQGGYGGGACVTDIPAHESRQFRVTVRIPEDAPPGHYQGTLTLRTKGNWKRLWLPKQTTLPVAIDVLPIDLRPVEGWYGLYYPAQPVHPERANYVSPDRYVDELRDQVRHGCNGVTLYGGFSTLELAKKAGMTQAPVLMHWPDGRAPEQVRAAQDPGFPDLYYYGVDEPHGDAVERCRKEAERRQKAGLHMFTAINSRPARDATKEFIDRPVYNIYVFDATSGTAAYAKDKGFVPISYWVTSISYPLYYRALTGLYNTAAGYLGTGPWAYADTPGDKIWTKEKHMHAVSYPDENGKPIPSLRWEAYRDGVDDVRYLQALDRVIERAAERLAGPNPPPQLATALAAAHDVRKNHYESIGGRWFAYLNSLRGDTLPATRRALADAIVTLSEAM
ncbi:MAG: DUF4091 domain-containing protein [Candidatus Pacebacteria bacterium]|nr:DUF4091 domain-containing protein [Candidatus Paceibacterota bacterium]